MNQSKLRKTCLGIFAAVAIGAVGSGAWEYILEPSLQSVGRAILTLGTLGVSTFKDSLYAEIARGHHESASLSVSAILYGAIGIAFVVFPLHLNDKVKELIRQRSQLLDDLARIESGSPPPQRDITHMRGELNRMNMNRLSIATRALIVLGIVTLSAQVVTVARDRYINEAITHYHRSAMILAPFLTDLQIRTYDSRFARIASSADYSSIVSEMRDIARVNNVEVPEFNTW